MIMSLSKSALVSCLPYLLLESSEIPVSAWDGDECFKEAKRCLERGWLFSIDASDRWYALVCIYIPRRYLSNKLLFSRIMITTPTPASFWYISCCYRQTTRNMKRWTGCNLCRKASPVLEALVIVSSIMKCLVRSFEFQISSVVWIVCCYH